MPSGAIKKTASALKPFILSFVYGVGVIFVVCAAIVLLWPSREVDVQIGQATFHTKVADTDATRTTGLSGRTQLGHNDGMLFVFDTSDKWRFWMKDMAFNLDIIWLNDHKQVVGMVQNADPASYPEVFTPYTNARYVLEVAAGSVQKFGIHAYDQASFALPAIQGGIIKL